jgi:hypothetical protein
MRSTCALAAGAILALAAAPVLALASSPLPAPTSQRQLAFQRVAARASAEATAHFTVWLKRETKNGMQPRCDNSPHWVLYSDAAQARGAANDQWLLAELVKAQGGNPGNYVKKATLLSRAAAVTTVTLRRCG